MSWMNSTTGRIWGHFPKLSNFLVKMDFVLFCAFSISNQMGSPFKNHGHKPLPLHRWHDADPSGLIVSADPSIERARRCGSPSGIPCFCGRRIFHKNSHKSFDHNGGSWRVLQKFFTSVVSFQNFDMLKFWSTSASSKDGSKWMVLGGPCLFHGPFTLILKASTSIFNWCLSLTKNHPKIQPASLNFGLAFLPPEVSRCSCLEIRPITCHGGTPRTVKWGAWDSRRQQQWPTEDVWFTFGSWSHWSWFGFRCSWGEKWRCWGLLEVG